MLGSPQEMYLASSSSCFRTYGEAAASHDPPDSSPTTNCSGRGDEDSDDHMLFSDSNAVEKEHMFDKVVTPSDVGKLNRLVIPKQHAERYFPLDSSAADKCMLLNFEDRNGKPWRFRYSYWNSSQSYVMTKGWSRFVKDKKLDAGDTVSFQRGVGDLGKDRLFIDWRRRPDKLDHLPLHISLDRHHHRSSSIHSPWNPIFLQHNRHSQQPGYNHPSGYGYGPFDGNPYPQQPAAGSIVYLSSVPGPGPGPGPGAFGPQQGVGTMHAQRRSGVGVEQMVFESVPVVQGKAAAKRLRLFGVNMDCPISESDECDILSSTTLPLPLPQNAATSPASTIVPILHHLLPHTHGSLHSSPSINPTDDHHNGKPPMSLDLHI